MTKTRSWFKNNTLSTKKTYNTRKEIQPERSRTLRRKDQESTGTFKQIFCGLKCNPAIKEG